MLNMMPLSRHALSLQTRLHRLFILGTVIPPTLGGGQVGRSGCTCMCKSWKMKSGCGGHIESTPPIGKVVPLGLVCDEKVLQDGWQGWTDMSKCGNAARFGTHACVHAWSARGRWEEVVGT